MKAMCRSDMEIESELLPQEAPLPQFLAAVIPENDLAFYQRRALEESVSAQRARCPRAAAAHRYLAAAYADQVRREMDAAARFEDLLGRLA
jgi:hypothetical protein